MRECDDCGKENECRAFLIKGGAIGEKDEEGYKRSVSMYIHICDDCQNKLGIE